MGSFQGTDIIIYMFYREPVLRVCPHISLSHRNQEAFAVGTSNSMNDEALNNLLTLL